MEQKTKTRGWLVRFIRILCLVYLGVCGLLFVVQRRLLYFPVVQSAADVSELARNAVLERWTNAAGQSVGMKRLAPSQPPAGSVLICYGNGSSATGCAHYADAIQENAALDVFILEYPGYADRAGAPTRETLLGAAAAAFQMLDADRPIYIVGESLGSGVAAQLASRFPEKISGLMLLSPFNRLAEVAQSHYPWLPVRWLLRDDLPSENYLRAYHGKVGIMVDGKDEVVPEKFGRRLFDGYAGPKQLWEFFGCGHIQIGIRPEQFWKEVIEFWQTGK